MRKENEDGVSNGNRPNFTSSRDRWLLVTSFETEHPKLKAPREEGFLLANKIFPVERNGGHGGVERQASGWREMAAGEKDTDSRIRISGGALCSTKKKGNGPIDLRQQGLQDIGIECQWYGNELFLTLLRPLWPQNSLQWPQGSN